VAAGRVRQRCRGAGRGGPHPVPPNVTEHTPAGLHYAHFAHRRVAKVRTVPPAAAS